MSTTVSPPNESNPENSASEANGSSTAPVSYAKPSGQMHFWMRRLHSLLGILFGGYIAVHLTVNAAGLWPQHYQAMVNKIHDLEPALPVIEIMTIFLPLIFHMVYGIWIASVGKRHNTVAYNYGGNIRYSLQRWTAFILLAFIVYHVGTLHKWGLAMFGVNGYPLFESVSKEGDYVAYQTTVSAIQTNWFVRIFYLVGIWSAVFHFANGLWTAAIAWGLTVTAAAQKRWGHVCLAFGIGLFLIGTTAWVAFAIMGDKTLDPEKTKPESHHSLLIVPAEHSASELNAK